MPRHPTEPATDSADSDTLVCFSLGDVSFQMDSAREDPAPGSVHIAPPGIPRDPEDETGGTCEASRAVRDLDGQRPGGLADLFDQGPPRVGADGASVVV